MSVWLFIIYKDLFTLPNFICSSQQPWAVEKIRTQSHSDSKYWGCIWNHNQCSWEDCAGWQSRRTQERGTWPSLRVCCPRSLLRPLVGWEDITLLYLLCHVLCLSFRDVLPFSAFWVLSLGKQLLKFHIVSDPNLPLGNTQMAVSFLFLSFLPLPRQWPNQWLSLWISENGYRWRREE